MAEQYVTVLERAGGFGLYQKRLLAPIAWSNVLTACNIMITIFLAGTPDHWCRVSSLDHLDLPQHVLVNLTIPFTGEEGYDQCTMYDRNYTGWSQTDVYSALSVMGNNESSPVSPCQEGWQYDQTQYQSTIVSQWDLVCDNSDKVSTAQSVYMFGLMTGVTVFGHTSDYFGRKLTMIVCWVLVLGSVIGVAFSPSYVFYVCMRYISGAASLGMSTTASLLWLELVGTADRLFSSTFYHFFWVLGLLVLAVLAFLVRSWVYLQLVTLIPVVIMGLALLIIPESPRWLYVNNKHEKADAIMRNMARVNKKDLGEKLDVVVNTEPKAHVWDLFRRPRMRLRSIIMFYNWFMVSLVYYGISLSTEAWSEDLYLAFFISGLMEVLAKFYLFLTLNRTGCRLALSGAAFLAGVALLCIVAVPDREELGWVTNMLAQIGRLGVTTAFALVYIYSGEIFPTVLRNVGTGASSFWARVGGILAPQIIRVFSVSQVVPMSIYGVLSLLAGLLTLLLLPEMKGRDLPQTLQDVENLDRSNKKVTTFEEQIPDIVIPQKGDMNGAANPAFSLDP